MEPSFTIRPALPVDVEPIFSILSEVACHVPIDLSTPKHVGALKAQVDECCRGGLSFVAVDEDNVVVAFQLAKRARWFDDAYIHLTYAGVTAAASGKKVFRRLIDAEKGHGLPLVAVVKPGNKSEMVARLTRYGFRPFSNAPVNFAYRWDPEEGNSMTEPKYEEFLWIKTSGDIGTGFMRLQFGMSRDDPMPFILTVMPSYVAHKTQKTLPLNITEVQNYCDDNREALRKIAFNCKQRGRNAEVLS